MGLDAKYFILSDYQAYYFWKWRGLEYLVIGGNEVSFKTLMREHKAG